ncbi:hypothetical protein [Nocardioides phosphati]|nr:hypothetical protein [Nocardioides phosphati]
MTIAQNPVLTSMHDRRLVWWANGLAVAAVILTASGLTVLAIVGFDANDEDFAGWKGVFVLTGLFGGTLVSIVAFVTAVVAKMRHERWALLWLPLLFGPAFIISLPFWFE